MGHYQLSILIVFFLIIGENMSNFCVLYCKIQTLPVGICFEMNLLTFDSDYWHAPLSWGPLSHFDYWLVPLSLLPRFGLPHFLIMCGCLDTWVQVPGISEAVVRGSYESLGACEEDILLTWAVSPPSPTLSFVTGSLTEPWEHWFG